MKPFLLPVFILLCLVARAEDITLNDGTVYKGATILHHDVATATILYDDGGAAVPISKLPADIQKRFDYDPAAAAKQLAAAAAADAQQHELATRTRVLDNAALKVWGKIIQVRSDDGGFVAEIQTVDKCQPTIPITQTTTLSTLPAGMGLGDVVKTTVVGYRHAKIKLGKVFVNSDVTGLVDQAHWRGIVWQLGTYSYVTDEGKHVTIPAYTVSPDRAYAALAQAGAPPN
jgi:hypothetical protein